MFAFVKKLFPFLFKLPGHNHRGNGLVRDCNACGDDLRRFVLVQVAAAWPKELGVETQAEAVAAPAPDPVPAPTS